jgi:hypothetical protein
LSSRFSVRSGLKARGYIVDQLPRIIFYEPHVKESD